MGIDDRTVVITGAAGNLGRAVAARFAANGANLVLLDRDAALLEAAFGRAGAGQLQLAGDLRDPAHAAQVLQAALARFARIDVLCNLAGGFRMGEAVHETGDDTWDFLYELNTHTLRNMVRVVVPHMIERGGGKIINVGANAAQRGLAKMGAYGAAKSSVIRLTEAMAAELREHHINVNCVLPSIIDTPQNRADMPDQDPSRWVAPADLAAVIAFLASDAARAIHGAALPVTGLS